MEKKKTKIILITIIVILVLIIIGLVCYIVLDKTNKINNEENKEDISSLDKNDEANNEQTIEEFPSEEKARKLTTEELEEFESYFNDLENNGFLLTLYNKPEEVDMNDVLYSNSIAKNISYDEYEEERKEYIKIMGWENDELPTSSFEYKTEDINNLLKEKMDMTLDDLEFKLEYTYIPKYDAYFDIHGDTNYLIVKVISGEINEDGLYVINYTFDRYEEISMKITMKKVENRYLFISNVNNNKEDFSRYEKVWQRFESWSTEIPEQELIINSIENDKVNFDFISYRLLGFYNATATLNGNIATFDITDENGWKFKGKMKFTNGMIKLYIMECEGDLLPTGSMIFYIESDESVLK